MPDDANDNPPVRHADLTRDVCPMTFVKAKLHIEQVGPGQLVEFAVKDGEAMRDLPRSMKEEGHRVEAVRKEGDLYYLLVRKHQ